MTYHVQVNPCVVGRTESVEKAADLAEFLRQYGLDVLVVGEPRETPETLDIPVHGGSGTVVIEVFGRQPDGTMRKIGRRGPHGELVPVPNEPPPPTDRTAEGVPLRPTVPATDTLFVAPTAGQSFTEQVWTGVTDIPESHKGG